ncbi:hypothetical protein B0A54_09078 [Friedmanniomyces endolithicus]|uniref:Uncharacterized protein n=1 Tax=Friedmanniomyces endolithicus TaxID=329885 RepID=A0A4U0UWV4_9PEZI|nr:hypothetical protein B0A54_09078 [Friedmanniomyces endolithicus]
MAARYLHPLSPPNTPPPDSPLLSVDETGYEADDESPTSSPSSSSTSAMQQHGSPLYSGDRSVRSATTLAALSTTTVPHDPRATAPAPEDHDWVYTACALWAQAGDSVNRWSDELASQRYLSQRGYDLTSDAVSARRRAEVLVQHERGCVECRGRRGGVCEGRKRVVNGKLERAVQGGRKRGREEERDGEEGEGKRRRVEMEGEARGFWRAVMMGTL